MNKLQRTTKLPRQKLRMQSCFIIGFFMQGYDFFVKILVSTQSDVNSCALKAGRKYFNALIAERISDTSKLQACFHLIVIALSDV